MTEPAAPWVGEVLATWRRGQALSAVGPGPVEDHLEHARSLAALIEATGGVDRGIDLGSGVGIPGLALAGLFPASSWVLLDAARRRSAVVEDAVTRLGWTGRVQVVHARAEDAARVLDPATVVVARSFGAPAVTAECAAPLVRTGGRVIVSEPAAGEERWPPDGLAPLGLTVGRRTEDPAFQVLEARAAPQARFPRKPGIAAKRPLW